MVQVVGIQKHPIYLLSFYGYKRPEHYFGCLSTAIRGHYNIPIAANCIYASQGFIFMMVYFTLDKMGRQKVECEPTERATMTEGDHPTLP